MCGSRPTSRRRRRPHRSPAPTYASRASSASQTAVGRIALSLPAVEQPEGRFAFAVRNKGRLRPFVWVWMERVSPKKPRVPNHDVVAVRVADLAEKERLLSANATM